MENILYWIGFGGIITSVIIFFTFISELSMPFVIFICLTIIIQSILIIGFGVLISVNKEIADLLRGKYQNRNEQMNIPSFPKES